MDEDIESDWGCVFYILYSSVHILRAQNVRELTLKTVLELLQIMVDRTKLHIERSFVLLLLYWMVHIALNQKIQARLSPRRANARKT